MTQIRSMAQPVQRRPGELGVHSLDHFNFVVPDVAQAEKFYGLFGLNAKEEDGKLALYTGCAGIRPEGTLPLTIDLGTSNKALQEDPLYMGSRRDKVTAEEEKDFLDELMAALKERWPDIVIQFEDWKNPFPSLERYRQDYAMFNDDIQGTGAVIMGGIIGAVKQSGVSPKDQRAVFLGSGSAGVGVAKQIVDYFMHEGLTEEEARSCFWLVDSKGLVTQDRGDKLAEHLSRRRDQLEIAARHVGNPS